LDYNNKTIAGNTELSILANTHIEIGFNYPIINMTNFFSEEYDNNIINVISIDFSYFNSSLLNNMVNIFFGCRTLESINFLNFDTIHVSNMANMFYNCSSLISINLSSFNTINLENMNSMFSGCILLESLDLFNFNTIKVKDMANTFAGCRSLKSINLSSFNTINVENMNSMFSGCILLESLNLFSFNVINVKDMANMFFCCSSLKSINLSNFFTDNLENMNSMFAQCISIESIILFNFNTLKVKDMAKIFEGCRALKSIDLSNFVTKNTENMNSFGIGSNSAKTIDCTQKVIDSYLSKNVKNRLKYYNKNNKKDNSTRKVINNTAINFHSRNSVIKNNYNKLTPSCLHRSRKKYGNFFIFGKRELAFHKSIKEGRKVFKYHQSTIEDEDPKKARIRKINSLYLTETLIKRNKTMFPLIDKDKSIIDDTDVSLGISMFNKGGKLNYHFNNSICIIIHIKILYIKKILKIIKICYLIAK